MSETKNVKMNFWKPCLVLLISAILVLTPVASASISKDHDHMDGQECDADDENVKEEIVGISEDGKDFLVKRVVSHPKDSKIKQKDQPQSGGTGSCYGTFARWYPDGVTQYPGYPVSYVVNPTGSGLDETAMVSAFFTSSNTWDDATSANLFSDNTPAIDLTAVYGNQDFRNAIDFAYWQSNTIAVTTTWYLLYNRQIVEFDMRINTYYSWTINADPNNPDTTKMDFQNIVTHEDGHTIGLKDLYLAKCNQQTMYGYSHEGETSKRTLESGDINGVQRLYG